MTQRLHDELDAAQAAVTRQGDAVRALKAELKTGTARKASRAAMQPDRGPMAELRSEGPVVDWAGLRPRTDAGGRRCIHLEAEGAQARR